LRKETLTQIQTSKNSRVEAKGKERAVDLRDSHGAQVGGDATPGEGGSENVMKGKKPRGSCRYEVRMNREVGSPEQRNSRKGKPKTGERNFLAVGAQRKEKEKGVDNE